MNIPISRLVALLAASTLFLIALAPAGIGEALFLAAAPRILVVLGREAVQRMIKSTNSLGDHRISSRIMNGMAMIGFGSALVGLMMIFAVVTFMVPGGWTLPFTSLVCVVILGWSWGHKVPRRLQYSD